MPPIFKILLMFVSLMVADTAYDNINDLLGMKAVGLDSPKGHLAFMPRHKEKKLPHKIGIYKIGFVGSSRMYIGSSNYIAKRRAAHISELNRGKNGCLKLQLAFNKYGLSSMTFEVLEYCSIEVLIEREQYYIDLYDSVKKGLNIGKAAKAAMLGRHHTKAARRKISNAGKGNKHAAGFKQTAECVQARAKATSKALTGRIRGDMRGLNHFNCKLTLSSVRAIRGYWACKLKTQVQLAFKYKCGTDTISRIVNYKGAYKYIDNDENRY